MSFHMYMHMGVLSRLKGFVDDIHTIADIMF